MSVNVKVLVVEQGASSSVGAGLREAGFEVSAVTSAQEALSVAPFWSPHLIIIDADASADSAREACSRLRKDFRTEASSIIILSTQAGEPERIGAFEAGADDFVTTPVATRELVLRARAVLRRRGTAAGATGPLRAGAGATGPLRAGALVLDAAVSQARLGDADVGLTQLEFRLLWTLATRPGGVHPRETLLRDVWGPSVSVEIRTVDQHVKRLRGKLGPARRLLRTVRGVGYRFEPL